MSTQHTPGPWEVIPSTSFPGRYLVGQVRRPKAPALAVADTIEVSAAEEVANARLIAAAPDLLAALEKVASHLNDALYTYAEGDVRDDLEAAENLIAKSRGTQ